MRQLRRCFLAGLLGLTIGIWQASEAATVFGPVTAGPIPGAGVTVYSDSFASDPLGEYVLHVHREGNAAGVVQVELNGDRVVPFSLLAGQTPGTAEVEIGLESSNTIEVAVRGRPGTSFTVWIERADEPPALADCGEAMEFFSVAPTDLT